MQESAVHEHSRRPAAIANADRYRQIWITRHCGSGRVSQVRSDDRIDTRVDYTINARARSSAGMRSRGDVGGIIRITWELFRMIPPTSPRERMPALLRALALIV